MQLTFFATDTDLLQVTDWLLATPGMTVFEPSSRPDLPNRTFAAVAEVAPLLREPGWTLGAWLNEAGAPPVADHVTFNPETQRRLGARGRTVLRSPSMIGLGRLNPQRGSLSASSLACWNERGARQRSIYPEAQLDEVDWKALRACMGRLRRRLSQASPAKLAAYPIMPDAFARMRSESLTLWNWGSPCAYASPHIQVA